jgi:hypothetical protein
MWCSHKGQCFHHWLILLHELGQVKSAMYAWKVLGSKRMFPVYVTMNKAVELTLNCTSWVVPSGCKP